MADDVDRQRRPRLSRLYRAEDSSESLADDPAARVPQSRWPSGALQALQALRWRLSAPVGRL